MTATKTKRKAKGNAAPPRPRSPKPSRWDLPPESEGAPARLSHEDLRKLL